jgi:hypothetical protein
MRIVRPLVALLVAFALAAAALRYMQDTWQDRIYLQDQRRSSADHNSFRKFLRNTNSERGSRRSWDPDTYAQRYYSESEGWTYYTLPSYSSARRSDGR